MSGSGSRASRDEILSLYGVNPGSSSSSKKPRLLQRRVTVESSQEVMSSQDDQEVQPEEKAQPADVPGTGLPAAPACHAQYFDSSLRCLVRVCGDAIIKAKMVTGPGGFALAYFDKEEFETEMPNLLLLSCKPVLKRPAAALRAFGAAAACDTSGCEEGEEEEEPEDIQDSDGLALAEAVSSEASVSVSTAGTAGTAASSHFKAAEAEAAQRRTYHKMYYKQTNKVGIRQNLFSHKQIFQFGFSGMPRDALDRLADQVLDRLHSGMGEVAAGEWVKGQIASIRQDVE